MVFIRNFRKEFYEKIQHERVLVLVGFDVDALCTCKILQYLFQCDNVPYTIVPVIDKQEMERAFIQHSQGVKYILMVNCGATVNVVEAFQPEEFQVFFICDSHRPVDVDNIYDQVQVNLLMLEEEFDKIPQFEQVFRDKSDTESDDDSDSSDNPSKRRRFDEDALEKRISRRKWQENRRKVLYEYEEFTGYGTSSAYLMYDMAWKMSKDTNDLLWLAIIGTTEQFLHEKIDRDKYMESIAQLQSHVSRLNHRPDDDDLSVNCLKLAFDQELHLTLYRHWSLFDSLCHSPVTASGFTIWTMKGKKRLHEFLAEMGFPLSECQQNFNSMKRSLREEVKDMVKNHCEKYRLTEDELFLPSFHAKCGYGYNYCAGDLVRVCEALLEAPTADLESSDSFLHALDVLNRDKSKEIKKGTELAKTQIKAIVNQVQTFFDMGEIISAGSFLYAFVHEGSPDYKFFNKPIGLSELARFTLNAYVSDSKRRKKAKSLPLVLGTPLDNDRGTVLVIGIPPVTEDHTKNLFGKAFEQAASHTNCDIVQNLFDTHIIELKIEDRTKFFDALISMLQQ